MKKGTARRTPVTVEVHEHDGHPIDLKAWADGYVARVLELERSSSGADSVGRSHPRPKERAS